MEVNWLETDLKKIVEYILKLFVDQFGIVNKNIMDCISNLSYA